MTKKNIAVLLIFALVVAVYFAWILTNRFNLPFWTSPVLTVIVLGILIFVGWNAYKCPECGYLLHDISETQTTKKAGIVTSGEEKHTCKCKRCGHEWFRNDTTPSRFG